MKIVTRVLPLLLSACLLWPQMAAAQDSSSGSSSIAIFLTMPQCALNCLIGAMGQSTCPSTNTTCMCADTKLQDTTTTCIMANCTILEALSAKNITAVGCNAPVRDRTGVFRTTSTTLGVITGCFLIARFVYRLLIARTGLGLDDWAALVATLVGVPSSIINIQGLAANGLGKDVWTLPVSRIYLFTEFFYIIEINYFTDIALLKLTLLFFYLRIFPSQGVRRLIWATIAFTVLYGVCFVFIGIFQCSPISYYWTSWDGEHKGRCLNVNGLGWANAAISIALDFWMLAIPLWQLRTLRLHWKKKISVAFMFLVGTFVTVVSILRLHSLLSFANSQNPTWDNYDVINWSTIEVNVGIICACLPSVRLMLVHFFPSVLASSSQRYYNNYYGNNRGAAGNPNDPHGRSGGGNLSHGGGGGGNSRAPRSIPLVSTTSSARKGTSTTVTTVNARDEEDIFADANAQGPYAGGNNNNKSPNVVSSHPLGPLGHGHLDARRGGGAPGGPGAGLGPGGILYSKTYAVEYGHDNYNDEARLVHEAQQQQRGATPTSPEPALFTKMDFKKRSGSESSSS